MACHQSAMCAYKIGVDPLHTSGASRRGNAEVCIAVIARSAATKQSILLCDQTGLLRFARNDGLKWLFEI
jgi:hypothetical protein